MGHGRLPALLLILTLFTACGNKGPKRWDSYPVTIYSDANIVSSASKESDLVAAMNFWEAKAGMKLFDYRGNWTGSAPFTGTAENPTEIIANVIFFLNPWSFAGNIAGQTIVRSEKNEITGSIIMINPHTNTCTGECIGNTSVTSQKKVFAHELGHFLGLGHTEDSKNIMYTTAMPGGSLDTITVDEQALRNLVED